MPNFKHFLTSLRAPYSIRLAFSTFSLSVGGRSGKPMMCSSESPLKGCGILDPRGALRARLHVLHGISIPTKLKKCTFEHTLFQCLLFERSLEAECTKSITADCPPQRAKALAISAAPPKRLRKFFPQRLARLWPVGPAAAGKYHCGSRQGNSV